jgi:hypothetical protein
MEHSLERSVVLLRSSKSEIPLPSKMAGSFCRTPSSRSSEVSLERWTGRLSRRPHHPDGPLLGRLRGRLGSMDMGRMGVSGVAVTAVAAVVAGPLGGYFLHFGILRVDLLLELIDLLLDRLGLGGGRGIAAVWLHHRVAGEAVCGERGRRVTES